MSKQFGYHKEHLQSLGIPLAAEKVEGPSTISTFLGIMIDTVKMEISLPDPKLLRICQTMQDWLTKWRAKKTEMVSLVGLLQHASERWKDNHEQDVFNHCMDKRWITSDTSM